MFIVTTKILYLKEKKEAQHHFNSNILKQDLLMHLGYLNLPRYIRYNNMLNGVPPR